MIVQRAYNEHTMDIQRAYNGHTMRIQSAYKVHTMIIQCAYGGGAESSRHCWVPNTSRADSPIKRTIDGGSQCSGSNTPKSILYYSAELYPPQHNTGDYMVSSPTASSANLFHAEVSTDAKNMYFEVLLLIGCWGGTLNKQYFPLRNWAQVWS